MEKNPELELAWQFIENTGTHLFLTGKAGTGKTTFLHKLKAESPKRMVVLAPTGIAAMNAGGITLHSFFQLPFAPYIPDSLFSDPVTLVLTFDMLVTMWPTGTAFPRRRSISCVASTFWSLMKSVWYGPMCWML